MQRALTKSGSPSLPFLNPFLTTHWDSLVHQVTHGGALECTRLACCFEPGHQALAGSCEAGLEQVGHWGGCELQAWRMGRMWA